MRLTRRQTHMVISKKWRIAAILAPVRLMGNVRMPHIFCIKHENVARCLFESATPFRLEIVQIASEGVSRLGSSVFAPVGRGTADHPDRDRQRDEHTADRRPDRQTRLHGQPRNQTQHMVPVQRERILPAVPAGASQDGAVEKLDIFIQATLDGTEA